MRPKARKRYLGRKIKMQALTRSWIAVGTLATYAAFGATRPALAAEKVLPTIDGAAPPTLPLKRFDIPAGPLEQAIKWFEKTTGVKVKVVLPAGTLAGFNSQGVVGLYREEDALRLLLDGTGLNFRMEDQNTVVVGVQASDTVSVSASIADFISMQKFPEPLIDTPQSVTVVPQFVMQDQGLSTLRDTLRNVPGISLAAGEAGAQGDNLTIRGFTARNDIFLDGIRDFGSYYRDSFNFEQVEALEGPAGIQFGEDRRVELSIRRAKIPGVEKFVDVQTQFGTDLTRRLTADLNSPLEDNFGGTAFRANVMAEEAGVAGRDAAEVRRFGIAPSISIGLAAKTPATLSYEHLSENDTPDYGLPWLFNGVAPAIRQSYFGFADENYLKTNDDILTLKVEHDFKPNLNVHMIARAANYPRDAQITEPQICSNASLSVPVGGVVSSLPTLAYNSALPCPYTPSTPADQINAGQPKPDSGQKRGRHSVGPDRDELPNLRLPGFTMISWRVPRADRKSRTRFGTATQSIRSIQFLRRLCWTRTRNSPFRERDISHRSYIRSRRAWGCTSSTP